MLYLLTAGKKALENGGVTEDVMSQLDKTRCGVLIGSAMGGMKVGLMCLIINLDWISMPEVSNCWKNLISFILIVVLCLTGL